jgi:hypothetical protein
LLLARGLPAPKVALTCYAITLVLVLIGLLILRTDNPFALWVLSIAVAVLLLAALRLGSLGKSEPRPRMQRAKI